jgi:hypothetical protein
MVVARPFLRGTRTSLRPSFPRYRSCIDVQATTVDETFSTKIDFVVHKIDVRYGCIMNCHGLRCLLWFHNELRIICLDCSSPSVLTAQEYGVQLGSYEISAARPLHDCRAPASPAQRAAGQGPAPSDTPAHSSAPLGSACSARHRRAAPATTGDRQSPT